MLNLRRQRRRIREYNYLSKVAIRMIMIKIRTTRRNIMMIIMIMMIVMIIMEKFNE